MNTRSKTREPDLVKKVISDQPDVFFKCAPLAYYLSDVKGTILDCNPLSLSMVGYRKKDVIGKNLLKFGFLSSDQLINAAKLLAKNALGKKTGPDEFTIKRKDGRKIIAEVSTIPIKAGKKKLVLAMLVDITEKRKMNSLLRESEQNYRDLFENANDLIQSVSTEGYFVYVNKKWRETLGYTLEEARKMNFTQVLSKESLVHCRAVFSQICRGRSFEHVKTVFVTKKGEELIVEGNLNALFREGKFFLTRGIFRNVTELRKREEEKVKIELLEAEVREREKLNIWKKFWASTLLHELRTPITSINLYSDMLLNDLNKVSSEQKKSITVIAEEADRLTSLSGRIIDIVLADTHDQTINASKFSLDKAIEESLLIVQPIKESKQISIVKRIPGNIKLFNDKYKFRIVLNNLLHNALKFTPRKGKILISAKEQGNMLLVSVSDNGPGISKKVLNNIFDRIYTKKDPSSSKEGFGLGLGICRSLVEIMKGKIWLESEKGKGVKASFVIPLKIKVK